MGVWLTGSADERWLDAQLDEVAAQGNEAMTRLETLVDGSGELSTADLSGLVAQAEVAADPAPEAPAEPVDLERRARIRQKIFDKVKPSLVPDWTGGEELDGIALGARYENEDTQVGWRTNDPVQKYHDFFVTRYHDRSTIAGAASSADEQGRVLGWSGPDHWSVGVGHRRRDRLPPALR